MPQAPIKSSPQVSVRPVEGKRDLDTFLRVPSRIFQNDPNWVAPLLWERKDHLNPSKNPFFQSADVAYWIAEKNGEVVGRISAQVNHAHEARYGNKTGHFGFIDAVDDLDVFAAFTTAAEGWLAERGMKRVVGPFSLSINDESGLLVEGFERPPSMMMGHALPYYGPYMEACGYTKAQDLFAYDYGENMVIPAAFDRLAVRVKKSGRLKTRTLDLSRYQEELQTVMGIFNDAWSENWGFLPFAASEIGYLAKAMKPIIDPNLVVIAEIEDKPVAMAIILPNLNEAIADLDGRLFPFGWAKLLWRLKVKGVKTGRMPLMGVTREFQASNIGALLALLVIREARINAKAKGLKSGELSWVLEENEPVRHLIETMGGDPYKRYRIYEKDLV